jgi:hypothetical protein
MNDKFLKELGIEMVGSPPSKKRKDHTKKPKRKINVHIGLLKNVILTNVIVHQFKIDFNDHDEIANNIGYIMSRASGLLKSITTARIKLTLEDLVNMYFVRVVDPVVYDQFLGKLKYQYKTKKNTQV